MSFSGTPLGQGRRLDHQTFLNGGHAPPTTATHPQTTNSPPRRPLNTASIPLSYAYGAPTLENRSPAKQPRAVSPRQQRNASPSRSATTRIFNNVHAEEQEEQEEEERALARFARLKQRNQVLASRPGFSKGPGIITSPPKPTEASLKDTSVNIASAFHQAADTFANMSSGSRVHLPRSTSVEYEQQSQSTSHRRLPGPPSRNGGSRSLKPPSRSHIPSLPEDERNEDSASINGRARSPFDHLSELAQRAMSPATYLLRQRSQEPEASSAPSRQATDATLVNHQNNDSNSYDFAAEEAEYQRSLRGDGKRTVINVSAAQKKSRISADNQAYQPSVSDLEHSEDDDDDDDRRNRKRKHKKKDSVGGPLTSLPVAGYDRRRKRRTRGGKEIELGDEESGSMDDSHSLEHQSIRSPTPTNYRTSVPRGSAPPPNRASVSRDSMPPDASSFERSGATDESMDIEKGLDVIPESEEIDIPLVDAKSAERTASPSAFQTTTGIGQGLGVIVNLLYRIGHAAIVTIFRTLAIITLCIGRLLGTTFNLLVRKPMEWVRKAQNFPFIAVGKYVVVAVGMYMAWYALRHPGVADWSGFPSRPLVPYHPSDVAPTSLDEITVRLLKLETSVAAHQANSLEMQAKLEAELRRQREIGRRIEVLEARTEKELAVMRQTEEGLRSASFQGMENIKKEVRLLWGRWEEFKADETTLDGAASAKLLSFEERLDEVESGVRDVMSLKDIVQTGIGAATGVAPIWWSQMESGTQTPLVIKTSDGKDVSSIISSMVDAAVAQRMADGGVPQADYAMFSGGAMVIPSLTSETWESIVKPGYLWGLIGREIQYGHPPVTALHYDTHLGHCWPIDGIQGRIGVKLAAPVYVTSITIDHIARTNAYDLRSAPRQMELWGLVEGDSNSERYEAYQQRRQDAQAEAKRLGIPFDAEMEPFPDSIPKTVPFMRIASFMYDARSPHDVQTFTVPQHIRELGIDFGIVILAIKNNWGAEFTCLYRLRVHGDRLVPLPPLLDPDSLAAGTS